MNATLPQYIEIRQNLAGQERPFIAGTQVRVQDVVIDHERFGQSPEEITRQLPQLSIAQVHGALAFFFENREAIWQCVREDEAYVDKLRSDSEQ